MFKIKFKPIYLVLAIIAAIILTLFLPVKIPYNIKISGKLISSEEWILTKGTDGRLISQVKDNIKGNSQNYSVTLFERGDIVSFNLLPKIKAGFFVNRNDTVGFIRSNEVQRNLTALQGQLRAKRAELEMYRSGEKESLVLMARQNLATAQKKAKMQRQILARQKEMYERNLISREKYEIEQTKTEVMEADIHLASARLSSLLEGAKEEQLAFIRSQIFAIEQEMKVYQQRRQSSAILGPIDGIVTSSFATDTLLRVIKIKRLVLVFPMQWRDKQFISVGQSVELNIPGLDNEPGATVLSVSNNLFNLSGRQVFLATALVDNEIGLLNPGLMARGALICGYVSPYEYMIRYIKRVFN